MRNKNLSKEKNYISKGYIFNTSTTTNYNINHYKLTIYDNT